MGRTQAAVLLLAGLASVARAQAPHIDSLDPAQGPIAGGTAVTVSGSGFAGASVTLDGKSIAPLSISDTRIRIPMPPHDNGYAVVKVSTPAGAASAEFLYVPPKLQDLPPGYITTVAGVGRYLRLNFPARTAAVKAMGMSLDAGGSVYFAWSNANRVFKLRPDGILELFAGDGTFDNGPNGDGGPATSAWISFCRTVSLDAAGNAYIPDESHRVRRVDARTGIITTIAGIGEAGFSGDGGPAAAARIDHPNFLAAAPDGTVYFIDYGNARIRKIATDGRISTIAGTGVSGDSGDGGPALQAQLEMRTYDYDTDGLALDPRGFLYFAEFYAGKIRRVDLATGIITTFFAGRPPDVPFVKPWALAVDAAGNVYVGCQGQIVELDSAGRVLATWGGGEYGFSEDGTSIGQMRVGAPFGLAVEGNGNLLFGDVLVARLRRINLKTGVLETLAGIAPATLGVPGMAVGASLVGPLTSMAFLPDGDLLYGDQESIHIFRIDPAGRISLAGGTGMNYGSHLGDGVPVTETAWAPAAIASDLQGGYYAADSTQIVFVDNLGRTHLVTNANRSNAFGYAGDGGPAADALLTQPWDVARDPGGNLFVADTNNNRIRRIDAKTGRITTVAGGGPLNGFEGYGHGAYCGDGGPALEACFNTPYSVAVDPDGNIFVSDFFNFRIRKIDSRGTISTFGNPGLHARIAADAYGGLFVNSLGAIERYLPDGTSWVIAGSWDQGFSGDGGPATSARINANYNLAAVAVDREGNLFFHDTQNARVRAVRFGAVLAPPDAQVAVTLGGGQSAPAGASYASPFEVTVRTEGGVPAPGVRVDFTAPSTGPSCVFSNGRRSISVLTDRSGKARAACEASCQAGAFSVAATALGSPAEIRFPLAISSSLKRCPRVIPPR